MKGYKYVGKDYDFMITWKDGHKTQTREFGKNPKVALRNLRSTFIVSKIAKISKPKFIRSYYHEK